MVSSECGLPNGQNRKSEGGGEVGGHGCHAREVVEMDMSSMCLAPGGLERKRETPELSALQHRLMFIVI